MRLLNFFLNEVLLNFGSGGIESAEDSCVSREGGLEVDDSLSLFVCIVSRSLAEAYCYRHPILKLLIVSHLEHYHCIWLFVSVMTLWVGASSWGVRESGSSR